MPTETIHILGVGNLGKFVAHSLAKDVACPVTLLFHREGLKEQWESEGSRITCITDGIAETTTDFGIEVLPSDTPSKQPEPNQHMIKNLVVTTKAYNIVSALSRIHHRLDPSSTILLLHNGMGTISDLNTTLFPTPSSRPALWTGITATGIHASHPFTIIRAGRGPLLLGPADPTTKPLPPLIQSLTRSPTLAATVLSAPAIHRAQLQKLVVNAVINPLTALSRCKNREVAEDGTLRRLAGRLIAEEIGPVVRGLLGEQQDGAGEFSDGRLLERVLAVARETRENTSSMLQDVMGGRRTEVGWINGFAVREGRRLGVEVGVNERLVALVEEAREGGGEGGVGWVAGL